MPRKTRTQSLGDCQRVHVISRCARSMLLLEPGDGEASEEIPQPRKQWFYDRLRLLHACFAVDVQGFAIMGNHVHLVLRLCPDQAAGWSNRDVALRWARLHPPRDGKYRPVDVSESWIREKLDDPAWLAATRLKLASLSQFMKDLKQPIAQKINRLEGVVGHFWQGRFKAVPLQTQEQHVAALAYVDLNPFSAGLGQAPEAGVEESGAYTSFQERAEAAKGKSQKALWFAPLQDPTQPYGQDTRPVFPMKVVHYLKLIDHLARCLRHGKRRLEAEVESIADRLGLPGHLSTQRFAACFWKMQAKLE